MEIQKDILKDLLEMQYEIEDVLELIVDPSREEMTCLEERLLEILELNKTISKKIKCS